VRACAGFLRPVDHLPADRCGELNLIYGSRQWTGERVYGASRPSSCAALAATAAGV
jgi:hypothetical protein